MHSGWEEAEWTRTPRSRSPHDLALTASLTNQRRPLPRLHVSQGCSLVWFLTRGAYREVPYMAGPSLLGRVDACKTPSVLSCIEQRILFLTLSFVRSPRIH